MTAVVLAVRADRPAGGPDPGLGRLPRDCRRRIHVPLGDIGDLGYATAPLEQALLLVDVLTLHVPLTSETRGLIGERELALIPAGA